jgi:hypothetical protein
VGGLKVKRPRPKLPSFGLPQGFEDINDDNLFEFEPPPVPRQVKKQLEHKAKIRLTVLRRWKAKWDEAELKWLKMRAAQLAAEIEADKQWLKEQAEREAAHERAEAEMARIRTWYAEQIARESAVAKRRPS